MTRVDSGGQLFVLSGSLGCGKSTLCRRVARSARRAGLVVAGVLSPARFQGGLKTGIEALDPRTGEARLLARLRATGDESGPRLGRWSFDADALRWGDSLLRRATPCDLLIVDEMGRLEFLQGQGWTGGFEAVETGRYGQAVVVVHRDLVSLARERWPRSLLVDVAGSAGRRALRERLLPGILEAEVFA